MSSHLTADKDIVSAKLLCITVYQQHYQKNPGQLDVIWEEGKKGQAHWKG